MCRDIFHIPSALLDFLDPLASGWVHPMEAQEVSWKEGSEARYSVSHSAEGTPSAKTYGCRLMAISTCPFPYLEELGNSFQEEVRVGTCSQVLPHSRSIPGSIFVFAMPPGVFCFLGPWLPAEID